MSLGKRTTSIGYFFHRGTGRPDLMDLRLDIPIARLVRQRFSALALLALEAS